MRLRAAVLLVGALLGQGSAALAHCPPAGVLQALTTEDGLPQNWVSALVQTRDGALWIGTDSGLVWYDGVEVVQEPLVAGEKILQLVEDAQGGYLLASNLGQWRLDGHRLSPLELDRQVEGPPFYVDADGGLWAIHPEGLVSLDAPGRRVHAPADCPLLRGTRLPSLPCGDGQRWLTLEGDRLTEALDVHGLPLPGPLLLRDSHGVSWVQDGSLVRRYIQEARGHRELEAIPGLAAEVTAILEAASGEIWMGTDDSRVLVWDGAELRLQHRLSQQVRQLFQDRDGSVWAATRGLGALRLSSPQTFTVEPDGLPDTLVWSALDTPDGTRWFATEAGLMRRDPGGLPVLVPEAATSPVHSLHLDAQGLLYLSGATPIASWDGRVRRDLSPPGEELDARGGILRDRGGFLWAGGKDAVWRSTRPDGPLARLALPVALGRAYPAVGAIVEDSEGRVWIGTNAGLLAWEAGAFTVFDVGHIRGLLVEEDGTVWATRKGGGLVQVRDGEVRQVQLGQGLPAETLHAMVFDDQGSAWFSSNQGVFRARRERLEAALADPDLPVSLSHYGIEDGLLSLECNSGYPSALRDTEGHIHFPTMQGLVAVDPLRIREATTPPRPAIRRLVVDAEEHTLSGPIRLPPETRSVAVHYSAPELRDPRGITYRYRLEGHDEAWVEADTRREALWTNLPPGDYTFHLQARSAEGVVSAEEATLPFTVAAHFSQLLWVRLLAGLGLVSLGAVLVRGQLHRIRERKLAALVRARTAELQAAHDLSAEQAARLSAQARELEAVDALKTRFFANVSHELRMPLALIKGPVSGALSAGEALSRADLERVERNARRLEELMEELLDMARLDAGRLPLQARETDLAAHLAERVEAFAPLARSRGVRLRFEGAPLTVCFDRQRLQKVVDNLLANAIRHTPDGGDVAVSLGVAGARAEVRVSDTGSGIPPEHLPHLFERFFQAPAGGQEPGTGRGSAGLGLALSHELALRHGGTLTVQSVLGEGSVFLLCLPLGTDHLAPEDLARGLEPPLLPAEDPVSTEPVSDTTVLVVEDDPDMRAWIRQVLSRHYAVVEAANGQEGLELARSHMPDLVLSDAMMPAMSGLELCAALRQDPATSHLPVVMLSARSATESRLEGLASGVDAYLSKPFHPDELLLQLSNLLAARARLQEQHRRHLVRVDETPEVASVEERFLTRVREAIRAHMSEEDFGVNELADAVHLSRRQLGRKLSALIGETPAALIRQLRLQRSRALLEQGYGSVSEVAYAVGYRRLASFSEQFRAEYGESPSDFRKGLKEPSPP
jgi:signal transduction histidine kinase/DNA-binding response OmpR family regulator/ligand-binding sensor domain-containing protein